ncbi:bestrophin family protein [Euzebyella saccharophila]|uniref:Bestrophin family protein n=1 Tax=Euzebyella saccharophila TaxID=679664 RepID=A0ABV8JT73_9FLAO|nr:bestrophin family ion channel [Euzebyella saccharophila]
MIVSKGIPLKKLFNWSFHHIVWLFLFMGGVAVLYRFNIISFKIPWLPVSVIGTAVAFYVGFKNNQSYGRMWEARKIWGGIVNDSRAWAMHVDGYITNLNTRTKRSETELQSIKKRLIYRHIGWLYTHREQLLVPTPWEHVSQGGLTTRHAERLEESFGVGLISDKEEFRELKNFLGEEEYIRLKSKANTATQIINEQSRDLRDLREEGLIDDFRHIKMQEILRTFFELQGKNERIKKFPFPRQYANMSYYFVGIFIFLLPFSMMPEVLDAQKINFWLAVPICVLLGWVYIMMELVGDYSENPFQRMSNDIPMLSLCRTIEIDLREILGETELPPPVKAEKGVLM